MFREGGQENRGVRRARGCHLAVLRDAGKDFSRDLVDGHEGVLDGPERTEQIQRGLFHRIDLRIEGHVSHHASETPFSGLHSTHPRSRES